MPISIRLYGPLEKYAAQPGLHQMEIIYGSLEQLLVQLRVPSSSVSFIVVNGVKRELEYIIKESDEVKVFSHVAGG